MTEAVMQTFDLIVVGAGSGNTVLQPELAGLRTAIVEPDRFGGTCLNRGCIPSKMFVVAADAVRAATEARRLGVTAHVDPVHWVGIRDRIFGRIDPLHEAAVQHRRAAGVEVFTEAARFIGPKTLAVGSDTLTAERIVVAAGSRPDVPDIPGLDRVPFHTSDTIMRIDELPRSMIIIGGGFIAAEMGHVFEAFGTRVHVVQRGPHLLPNEDDDISTSFTDAMAGRFDLHLSATVASVAATHDGVAVTVDEPTGRTEIVADVLLVATGRVPNTDRLAAEVGGLALDEHGHITTDDAYRTSVPGVWSLGDVANHFQLKHMANAEVRVVTHNLLHPDEPQRLRFDLVPHAVFSDPQIASVGLTEQAAIAADVDHVVSVRQYADTAYGWALEDTTSFVKLVADRQKRVLVGAHIIGPQAALLIQPLLQAMMLGQTVDQLANDVLYIHPALSEVVEQALLGL